MGKTLKRYGPPGCGKTNALLVDFQRELKKVSPDRIAFLTFTRAARMEALTRIGRKETELPYLRTIHAICYRQLGVQQGQIVKIRDVKAFGNLLGLKITGNLHDPWMAEELEYTWEPPTKADQLLQLNHLGRHRQINLKEALEDAPKDIDFKYAKWFTQAYRDWKKQESVLDYTDLLTEYLERGKPLDIDVLFVDEAQDLSHLQWQVVHKLGSLAKRVYLAGDDDQAIFVWAGASASMFNNEPADKTEVLGQSWRVPRSIQSLAGGIISRVADRFPKEWKARDAEGQIQNAGFLHEDYLKHDGDTFVLFRNHHRGHQLSNELMQLGWPFTGAGSPLGWTESSSALSGWYSSLVLGNKLTGSQAWAMVNLSSVRFLNDNAAKNARRPATPIDIEDIFIRRPSIDEWPKFLHRLPCMDYLQRVSRLYGFERMVHPKTQLMSIHQSKGRQAETVVLDCEMARAAYEGYMRNPDDEHRVWYVGVTRAKERLYVLLAQDERNYQL